MFKPAGRLIAIVHIVADITLTRITLFEVMQLILIGMSSTPSQNAVSQCLLTRDREGLVQETS